MREFWIVTKDGEPVGVNHKRPLIPAAINYASIHVIEYRAFSQADAELREFRNHPALKWESDHQKMKLEELGLAEEFPFGCDAIEHVGEALIAARKNLNAALEREAKLFEVLKKYSCQYCQEMPGFDYCYKYGACKAIAANKAQTRANPMTDERRAQIEKAAHAAKKYMEFLKPVTDELDRTQVENFILGAMWADENPPNEVKAMARGNGER